MFEWFEVRLVGRNTTPMLPPGQNIVLLHFRVGPSLLNPEKGTARIRGAPRTDASFQRFTP